MATANTYVNVKRVFNTQPEVPRRVHRLGPFLNATNPHHDSDQRPQYLNKYIS